MLRVLDVQKCLATSFLLNHEIISVRLSYLRWRNHIYIYYNYHTSMDVTKSQSQGSIDSIDSSALISETENFQSTQSLASISSSQLNLKDYEIQNYKYQNMHLPKQLPRIHQQKRQSNLFSQFQQPFIGFVGFGKNKDIFMNQSKLKRAKKFMDLDEQYQQISYQNNNQSKQQQNKSDYDSQSTQSLEECSKFKNCPNIKLQAQQQFPQFSLGFKSLGSGKVVIISQQASNKVKLMFGEADFSQPLKSKNKQKPTKQKMIKNEQRQSIRFTNFLKTQKVKLNTKEKINHQKIENKKAVYQGKDIIQGVIAKVGNKYQNIKLVDLPSVSYRQAKQFASYWQKYQYIPETHVRNICSVRWCYFCQKYFEQQVIISKQFIQKQVKKSIKIHQQTKRRIPKLIQLIIFKLAKFQFFNPQIKNKRVNGNNILLQLYRKCSLYEKQNLGALQNSLLSVINSRGKGFGKQINLMVVSIALNEQMGLYFVELTDGWSCVYAVIAQNSDLGCYVHSKIEIGTKLQIVNWNIYPLSNIIQHHPNPEIGAKDSPCIEFSYNNSMPSPYFSKLGWTKQIFYKPIGRCKETGGSIPVIQGIVIRMFSIKNNRNINNNYLQILVKEGQCVLIKIPLAEQMSLVQLFRLYYCYHFIRVKKIAGNMLQFNASTKYQQVEDPQRMEKVRNLLRKRLCNVKETGQMVAKQAKLQNKKLYIDLVTKSSSLQFKDMKIVIQQKIQGIPILLQQYTLSTVGDNLILAKGDRGSCLRKIPKIYQSINYSI